MKIDIQKKIFHDCQLIKQMECEMKTKINGRTIMFFSYVLNYISTKPKHIKSEVN